MKKTNKIRLLAFILTLCMMIGVLPLYVFADGIETELPEQITETTNENLTAFQLGLGEKSVAELENMTLSAADIPASISRETVEAKDHVLRLREQEADLNTVIFQNRDGGKTVYLFGSPVKYVDANGNIRDKSTTLVSENVTVNGKTYAHSATDNFFGQYYPTMPQNGVMLAFGQYTVEMKPVITGVLTLRDTVVSDNKVTYNKVFGTGTSLVYTPTLNGVKEDIILQTYTGKSSFSFTIKTNGLAIIQDENDTFLADFEGNKVASLGDVIITDSANHTAYGTMTVVTKIEREEYTVTVNAPTAFLTNPTTVYPVTVDPTFIIYEYDPDGSGDYPAIDDLCIYNGSTNPYTNGIASIGNYSCYGETDPEVESARMLYKFNSDYSMLEYPMYYMSSSLMESASLHLYGHVFESDLTVTAYECTSTWENGTSQQATSTLWNAYNEDYSSDTTVSAINFSDIEIDVTEIFSHWAEDDSFAEYGIMLMVNGEGNIDDTDCYYQLILRQTEHETSNTYFSIDYTTFEGAVYINNKDTGKFLLNNGTSTALTTGVYSEDDSRKWGLLYLGENKYTISLYSNVRQILGVSENSLVYGVWSVAPSDNFKWELTHTSTYSSATIKNVATGQCLYVNASGNISLGTTQSSNVNWRLCKISDYKNLTSFNLSGSEWVDIGGSGQISIGTKSPTYPTWSNLSDFTFTSSNTYDATVSSTGVVAGASVGYSIISATHKPTGRSASIVVTVGQIIDDGKYYITNKGNGLALATSTEDIYVEQNNIESSNRQRWKVTYIGNGYYYLDVILGVGQNEAFVFETNRLSFSNSYSNLFTGFVTSTSPCTSSIYKIRLLRTSSGGIKITSEYSESSNKVMAVTDNVAGSNCTQNVYTADGSYLDEWVFEAHRDASFIGIPDTSSASIFHNHSGVFSYLSNDLEAIGCEFFDIRTSLDLENCIDIMASSTIVIFRGHGSQHSYGLTSGSLSCDALEKYSNDIFKKTKLVVYGSCECGLGEEGSYNLVNSTNLKGAETVVGFTEKVGCNEMNCWIEYFIEYIVDGDTVRDACRNATQKVKDNDDYWDNDLFDLEENVTTDSFYIAGNENNIIS